MLENWINTLWNYRTRKLCVGTQIHFQINYTIKPSVKAPNNNQMLQNEKGNNA